MKVKLLSPVQFFLTPWTVACQAPPSMRFPRQEYWRGLPFSSPGDLPDPGIKPGSPVFAGRFFTIEPPGKLTRVFPSGQLLPTFNKVRKAVTADDFFLFFISTYLTRNSCVGCEEGALRRTTEEVKGTIIQLLFLPYSPFSVPSSISYSCFSLSVSHSLLLHFSSSSSLFPTRSFTFLSPICILSCNISLPS